MSKLPSVFHHIVLLSLCFGLTLSACQSNADETEDSPAEEEQESAEVRPEVLFAVADDEPIYQYIESQGVVEANQSVELKPKISGYVERSHITEGKRVQKGQELLVFDQREYVMAVDQARNTYEEAKQKYDIEMGMRTGQNTVAGTSEGQDASTPMVRITTGLAQAELDLKQAQLDLSYTKLKVPFLGVLSTQKRLAPGTYVTAGTTVGQLVDDQTVRLRFDVLESELGNISKNMNVQLTAPGGQQLQGQVEAIQPVVNTETKTGTVIVWADNSGQLLRPGMTVEGRIETLQQEGKVRVPRSAILSRDGGRTLLFKLNTENNQVEWVYVEPAAQNSEWTILNHEDIAPGDTIAVDRHFALSHLQAVEPQLQLSNQEDSPALAN